MDDYDEMFMKHLGILGIVGACHIALVAINTWCFGWAVSSIASAGVVLAVLLLGAMGGFWIDRDHHDAVRMVNLGISINVVGGLVSSSVLALQLLLWLI